MDDGLSGYNLVLPSCRQEVRATGSACGLDQGLFAGLHRARCHSGSGSCGHVTLGKTFPAGLASFWMVLAMCKARSLGMVNSEGIAVSRAAEVDGHAGPVRADGDAAGYDPAVFPNSLLIPAPPSPVFPQPLYVKRLPATLTSTTEACPGKKNGATFNRGKRQRRAPVFPDLK